MTYEINKADKNPNSPLKNTVTYPEVGVCSYSRQDAILSTVIEPKHLAEESLVHFDTTRQRGTLVQKMIAHQFE